VRALIGLFSIGAASAMLSNMVYGRKIWMPYGPTQTLWAGLYYLIVVPLVGAAAGALLVALARSELLFSFHAGTTAGMTPIRIALTDAARPFAYVIMAATGGFLGDRILRNTFEKVYSAMFRDATKDSPSARPGESKAVQSES
jgi:hypothetical protein